MSAAPLAIEQILTMLAATPACIADSTNDLTSAQLRTALNLGEWSANDVLAHMRSCADVWGNCIAEILAHEKPTIRAINPRTWIKRTDYPEQEFQPSLRAFTEQRADLLQLLAPLSPEDWSRSATVTGAGNVLQRTVRSYADWLAYHERPHIKQIERIVNMLHK